MSMILRILAFVLSTRSLFWIAVAAVACVILTSLGCASRMVWFHETTCVCDGCRMTRAELREFAPTLWAEPPPEDATMPKLRPIDDVFR